MKPQAVAPSIPAPGRHTVRALLSGLVLLGLLAPQASPAAPADEKAPATQDAKAAPAAEEKKSEPAEEAKEEPKEEKAAEEPPALEAAPGEYRNWFETSVGGLLIDGNKAGAQRRLGLPDTAFGGVSSFHFEKDIGKKAIFKVDGRGIFDNEDYGLRLEYNHSEKGFVRGGLSQYREYYDGSGGWAPSNNQWFDLYSDAFHVVRGNAFFEAGLRVAGKPEITIRYDRDWREGLKDSTSWGNSYLTGTVGPRAFVPAFWGLDEDSNTLTLDVRHTLGKTTFGGAFLYEHSETDNSRFMRRDPFDISDRHTTHTERTESDLYGARAFVDTTFSPKLRFTSAYAFTTLETQLAGSRIIGADYDAVYDPVFGRRDVGFLNLAGLTQLDQHVWNANVMWTPIPSLAVIPAFRIENQAVDGASSRRDTGAVDLAREAANTRDMLDLSQQIEVRYTGITNVVLYARGDWVQGDGNLLESEFLNPGRTAELRRDTDFDRFSQKYTAGASWYPLQRVNLHAQYYRKMRENSYTTDPTGYLPGAFSGLYPGFIENHDFTTDDVNFRVTWRPLDKLALVSRYDLQFNTVDMQAAGLPSQRGAEQTAHIFGETITWTPLPRLYIQPGVNYVIDTTRSPAAEVSAFPGAPVEDAHNDYVNVTCTVGVVLDDRTDLQTQYNWYLADNFNNIAAFTQPYGAGFEEHGILTSLIRRINPRLKVTLRYGFFSNRGETDGGFNNYDAHLVYASTQYLF